MIWLSPFERRLLLLYAAVSCYVLLLMWFNYPTVLHPDMLPRYGHVVLVGYIALVLAPFHHTAGSAVYIPSLLLMALYTYSSLFANAQPAMVRELLEQMQAMGGVKGGLRQPLELLRMARAWSHLLCVDLWVSRWMVHHFHKHYTAAYYVAPQPDGSLLSPYERPWTQGRWMVVVCVLLAYQHWLLGLVVYFTACRTLFASSYSQRPINARQPQAVRWEPRSASHSCSDGNSLLAHAPPIPSWVDGLYDVLQPPVRALVNSGPALALLFLFSLSCTLILLVWLALFALACELQVLLQGEPSEQGLTEAEVQFLLAAPQFPYWPFRCVRQQVARMQWALVKTRAEQRGLWWQLRWLWLQPLHILGFVANAEEPLSWVQAMRGDMAIIMREERAGRSGVQVDKDGVVGQEESEPSPALTPSGLPLLPAASASDFFAHGLGLGVASHARVRRYLSHSPRKAKLSLGWAVSNSQVAFSRLQPVYHNTDTELLQAERSITCAWLHSFPHQLPLLHNAACSNVRSYQRHGNAQRSLMSDVTWMRLSQLLPRYPQVQPSEEAVWRAVGETMFFLATSGSMRKDERDAFIDGVGNPVHFLPTWINSLFLLGGVLERKSYASFHTLLQAFARYSDGPALQAAFHHPSAAAIGATHGEVLRMVTEAFFIAGAAAPCKLAFEVVRRLWEHRLDDAVLRRFDSHPDAFITECARLDKCVPMVTVLADEDVCEDVRASLGIDLEPDTAIHCAIQAANRDPSVFPNPDAFDPFRPQEQLDRVLSWNGPLRGGRPAPSRLCPGHRLSVSVLHYVASRFAPLLPSEAEQATRMHRDRDSAAAEAAREARTKRAEGEETKEEDERECLEELPEEEGEEDEEEQEEEEEAVEPTVDEAAAEAKDEGADGRRRAAEVEHARTKALIMMSAVRLPTHYDERLHRMMDRSSSSPSTASTRPVSEAPSPALSAAASSRNSPALTAAAPPTSTPALRASVSPVKQLALQEREEKKQAGTAQPLETSAATTVAVNGRSPHPAAASVPAQPPPLPLNELPGWLSSTEQADLLRKAERHLLSAHNGGELRDSLDWFTRLIMALMDVAVIKFNGAPPRVSDMLPPVNLPHQSLQLTRVTQAKWIPQFDEDDAAGPDGLTSLAGALLQAQYLWPFSDVPRQFVDLHEALRWRQHAFSALPPPNVAYQELSSDEAQSRLAFFGQFCHHTRRIDWDEPMSVPEQVQLRHPIPGRLPKPAVFVNDQTALYQFRVREPFENYGAAAYFDEDRLLVALYWSHEKRLLLASDHDLCWEHVKLVWRTSAFSMATIRDHLMVLHLTESNALVSASRQFLSDTHPLRVFLKPFTFRTVSINAQAAQTLINDRGLVHRVWAFEYDEFISVCDYMNLSYRFRTLPNWIHPSMKHPHYTGRQPSPRPPTASSDPHLLQQPTAEDDDEAPPLFNWDTAFPPSTKGGPRPPQADDAEEWSRVFPISEDLPRFWQIVREYVEAFFDVEYPVSAEAAKADCLDKSDEELQHFARELCKQLGLSGVTSRTQLIDVLAQCICAVTGLHEHVGQISELLYDPTFINTKLRRADQMQTVQTYSQHLVLVVLTGLRMPALLDDWTHILAALRHEQQHVHSHHLFKHRLRQRAKEVDEANLPYPDGPEQPRKGRLYPFQSFNPRFMECSISV